ncbi:unnamed protein product [Ilex paraguariensis]|uniref:Uncharacterized protein n=1 Tax=Ilex paraguariensis TaxID=185542 RepID=A0ABC8SG03_9AQUA
MKIQVEVLSRETIKPSSPTPSPLRNYPLSFLDQISPPIYMPMIFFYESSFNTNLSNDDKSDRLKISLSETLTRFYPLAGRLVDNISIDCNDEGIVYSEARVKCQLVQVIQGLAPDELNKFLPCELDDVDETVLAVQVNFFDCGGMAVGVCTSHKIADALSIALLITGWAATSRGDSNILCPQFESAKLFPPRNISGFKPTVGITKEKIVVKRFVFNNSIVAALREKYTDFNDLRPTRIEALSAFIWDRFRALTEIESSPKKMYSVLHAVNLRTRMDPPLPEHSFGNLYRIAIATPSMDTRDESCDLVKQMREAIKNIDGDYVTKLREGDEHLNLLKENAQRFEKGEMVSFSFTSLCRFRLYDVDFGWGRPVKVGSTRLTFKNLVTFMDTREGDGIEAWLNLEEGDMVKFEVDEELLAHISPTSG